MNKQEKLQNIWAKTDEPAIQMMMKKTCQSPSTPIRNDSTDRNSDSESVDSIYGSFVAVPKEFRPPVPIRTKIEYSTIYQTENKQDLLKQNPTKENLNSLTDTISQKISQVANDNTAAHIKAKYNSAVNRKTPLQSPKKMSNNSSQTQGSVLHTEGLKNRNEKNINKNKCTEKQKHRTLKLNFEMPTKTNPLSKDGLKIDPIKNENREYKKLNRKFLNGVEQHFCKDAHSVSYQKSVIKWDSSLSPRQQSSNTDKFKQDSCRYVHGLSFQENIVKWDSSLNLDKQNSDTEDKTEQKFDDDTHRASYRKHVIKWHSSLNVEHSSDSESEIEWTVIREKKTTVSAKKVQSKNHIHKQINQFPAANPCARKKVVKWHHKKNFNNNFKKPNTNHQKNTSRPDPIHHKDAEKVHFKNNFQENSNLKCDNMEIQNCKTQKECNLDAETFTQQCKVSENNLDNPINPSLSNEKTEFVVNSNTRKNINSGKSNLYPNIDNATLKLVEDQKKSMLHYGREMADLIISSHAALSVFISMFNEWKLLRIELIHHFNYLENNLKESSKKFTKYKDLLNYIKTGATLATAVPIPHVSIAAKVVNVLTGLFAVFLTKTATKNAEVEDSNEITLAASRDTNAANDVYEYGLMCGMQFEETAKLFEEFHSNAGEPEIFENDSPEIATFIRGVLEYKPRHRIFYKKLHKCFQELLQNSTSEFSKRFCEPFLLYSSAAIDVIGFLDWRFRHEDFNGESVRFELREIERLIEGDTSIKELMTRVQNCVRFLEDELKFLDGCVKKINLFDSSVQHGIKAF